MVGGHRLRRERPESRRADRRRRFSGTNGERVVRPVESMLSWHRAASPRGPARRTSWRRSPISGPRRPPTARRGMPSSPASVSPASAAADCASADLARLVDLLDVCDDTWKGVVPPGGACMTYASCAEPAVTGGASAGASCVNSMCVQVVRQPAGAPCSQTPPVVLTCNPLLAACGTGVCVALPGAGEACAGDLPVRLALRQRRLRAPAGRGPGLHRRRRMRQRRLPRRTVRLGVRRATPSTARCPENLDGYDVTRTTTSLV